jgi:hypothetical protein
MRRESSHLPKVFWRSVRRPWRFRLGAAIKATPRLFSPIAAWSPAAAQQLRFIVA